MSTTSGYTFTTHNPFHPTLPSLSRPNSQSQSRSLSSSPKEGSTSPPSFGIPTYSIRTHRSRTLGPAKALALAKAIALREEEEGRRRNFGEEEGGSEDEDREGSVTEVAFAGSEPIGRNGNGNGGLLPPGARAAASSVQQPELLHPHSLRRSEDNNSDNSRPGIVTTRPLQDQGSWDSNPYSLHHQHQRSRSSFESMAPSESQTTPSSSSKKRKSSTIMSRFVDRISLLPLPGLPNLPVSRSNEGLNNLNANPNLNATLNPNPNPNSIPNRSMTARRSSRSSRSSLRGGSKVKVFDLESGIEPFPFDLGKQLSPQAPVVAASGRSVQSSKPVVTMGEGGVQNTTADLTTIAVGQSGLGLGAGMVTERRPSVPGSAFSEDTDEDEVQERERDSEEGRPLEDEMGVISDEDDDATVVSSEISDSPNSRPRFEHGDEVFNGHDRPSRSQGGGQTQEARPTTTRTRTTDTGVATTPSPQSFPETPYSAASSTTSISATQNHDHHGHTLPGATLPNYQHHQHERDSSSPPSYNIHHSSNRSSRSNPPGPVRPRSPTPFSTPLRHGSDATTNDSGSPGSLPPQQAPAGSRGITINSNGRRVSRQLAPRHLLMAAVKNNSNSNNGSSNNGFNSNSRATTVEPGSGPTTTSRERGHSSSEEEEDRLDYLADYVFPDPPPPSRPLFPQPQPQPQSQPVFISTTSTSTTPIIPTLLHSTYPLPTPKGTFVSISDSSLSSVSNPHSRNQSFSEEVSRVAPPASGAAGGVSRSKVGGNSVSGNGNAGAITGQGNYGFGGSELGVNEVRGESNTSGSGTRSRTTSHHEGSSRLGYPTHVVDFPPSSFDSEEETRVKKFCFPLRATKKSSRSREVAMEESTGDGTGKRGLLPLVLGGGSRRHLHHSHHYHSKNEKSLGGKTVVNEGNSRDGEKDREQAEVDEKKVGRGGWLPPKEWMTIGEKEIGVEPKGKGRRNHSGRAIKLDLHLSENQRDLEVGNHHGVYGNVHPHFSETEASPPYTPSATHLKALKRRKILLTICFVSSLLFILSAIANLLLLDIKVLPKFFPDVFSSRSAGSSIPSSAGSNSISTLMANSPYTTTCMSLFSLTAPNDPHSFPCDQCLPFLSPPTTSSSTTPPISKSSLVQPSLPKKLSVDQLQAWTNATGPVMDFCALKGMYAAAQATPGEDGQGQQNGTEALDVGGWMRDNDVCEWAGVKCDGEGKRVVGLSLQSPSLPSSLPPLTFSLLSSLTSLSIIGSGSLPTGSLPQLPSNLTSVHIENTALQGNLTLRKMDKVQVIRSQGVKVDGFASAEGITELSLSGQQINGGSILNDISSSAGWAKSLVLLDLSNNGLSEALPEFANFTSLQTLILSNNSLISPLPSSLPTSLTTLDLSNNPSLGSNGASLPQNICSSSNLKQCSVKSDGMSAPQGCGVCQF